MIRLAVLALALAVAGGASVSAQCVGGVCAAPASASAYGFYLPYGAYGSYTVAQAAQAAPAAPATYYVYLPAVLPSQSYGYSYIYPAMPPVISTYRRPGLFSGWRR